ncbi:flavodoxin [Oscillospiraceae bacterium 44-5]
MKNIKRVLSSLLAAVMLLAVAPAALAADANFSDVTAGVWYADAVNYVTQNNLMDPVSSTSFAPDAEASRAALAVALYRAAGSPAVGAADFTDVPANSPYASAAAWAKANGVIAGYDDGRFGGEDSITREQIVTILWRYSGSPAVSGEDFADEASISGYARTAVDWARTNNIVSGVGGNRFDPQGHTTRAQLAVILRGYLTANQSGTPDTPSTGSRILVVYYSATGSTQRVGGYIADALNADTFELIPVNPYSDADLNWTNSSSRVNDEHDNPALRDIALVSTTPDNWADYDTVLIGYPIWWGIAAWPVDNFVKNNDFTGKTVIPFCTSSSSGLGQSGELLEEMAGTGNWQSGQRFSSSASQSQVASWAEGLDIKTGAPSQSASRSLVVYFSMPETTNPNNMTTEEDNSTVVINGEVLGNTQYMAYVIQEHENADIFRIEPVNPYPTDHSTLVDQARNEQDRDFRPAIAGRISNLADYDTIYLGYPNWWGDMPMILYSFLEQYDFSGKTIIPFNTHGGSGFSGTIGTIRSLEPQAEVLDGLSISRNSIQNARQEIINWLDSMK